MDTLTTLEKVIKIERCLPIPVALRFADIIFEIKSPRLEHLVNALYNTFCEPYKGALVGLHLFNTEEMPFVEEVLDLVDGFIKIFFSPQHVYTVLSSIRSK